MAELRGEIDRHGGRLGDQANAAADRLRERVDLQIRSLGEVAAAVGRRTDEIDQLIRSEAERMEVATSSAGDKFRAIFTTKARS